MNRIRTFLRLLAACCCACILAGFVPASGAAERAALTLMVYLTGSDLESGGQAASRDLEEMSASLPRDGRVRLLVQAGGTNAWGTDLSPEMTTRLEVLPGGRETAESFPARSMGAGDTLRDFLLWGFSFAPADRYALILWDHGGGPLMGICFDEQHTDGNGEADALSLREIAEALEQSPFRDRKLAFIGMDACLMCGIETAAAVSPYADCLIASQDVEPADGWNYSFLKDADGSETGAEWGKRIIGAYAEALKDTPGLATLACIDLNRIPAVLEEMETFFSGLTGGVTPESYPEFTACRSQTKAFGTVSTSEYDLIDLTDLIGLYEANGLADGAALKQAVRDAVVMNYAKKSDYTNGLSIYYPFDNKSRYVASWAGRYQEESFSPAYVSFIRRVSDFYLQKSLFDPGSSYQISLTEYEGKSRIELSAGPEERAQIARARLLVLEEVAAGNYRLVYYDDQRIRQAGDAVSALYGSDALFLTDAEGNIAAGPVSYLPVENGVALFGMLIRDFTPTAVRLVYQFGEDGQLALSAVFTPQGESGMFLPSSLRPEDCDEAWLLCLGPQDAAVDEPVTSLKMSAYFPELAVSFDPRDSSLRPAFVRAQGRYPRFAYLRLTDIRGETFFSEVRELPNYSRISVAAPRPLEGTGEISAELLEGDLVTGFDAGLTFTVRLRNRTAGALILSASRVTLEDAVIGREDLETFRYLLAPEESDRISVFVPLSALRRLCLPGEIGRAGIVFSVRNDQGQESEFAVSFDMTMNASFLRDAP